jgi:hypothetical protein
MAVPTATMPDVVAALAGVVRELEQALTLLELAARNDRETLGELAGAVNRHDDELAGLRDELVGIGVRAGFPPATTPRN